MLNKALPLKQMSIHEIYNGEKATYEVPIYQRNYAWEKDEITLLIQDVYDSFITNASTENKYFIGTLVSFHKGGQIYEVIDGQQRLTTINIVLGAMDVDITNKLTYRARKKSNGTIENIHRLGSGDKGNAKIEEQDNGILNGFKYAKDAIKEIVHPDKQEDFKKYFQHNVSIIHYQVPKDIDLNHYFEIMNSRGEQLEKHEIIKARLIAELSDDSDKLKFNHLWECCSEMNVYIQQKYSGAIDFCSSKFELNALSFDELQKGKDCTTTQTILELIERSGRDNIADHEDTLDSFQPVIDFPNFLLIVLKLTCINGTVNLKRTDSTLDGNVMIRKFDEIILDDKELIREFDKVKLDTAFAKQFGVNLFKAKFLLDNYLVHHSSENETSQSNPWKLQRRKGNEKENLASNSHIQDKLVHLLSMFEVTYSAKQRKNYLFYCLLHLFHSPSQDVDKYCEFVSSLADKYFKNIYLREAKDRSFDKDILGNIAVLKCNTEFTLTERKDINIKEAFINIYGNGEISSSEKNIPLFVFNYLDYKLWQKYADELRGKNTQKGDKKRNDFFSSLGCNDFELDFFNSFYFSRTRRSLEHYYAQANLKDNSGTPTEQQINCFGNYAMIGSEANSSGSNWTPIGKFSHYLDKSNKISPVSVGSIKFMIMMQKCKENKERKDRLDGQEWNFYDMKSHQEKMLALLNECIYKN